MQQLVGTSEHSRKKQAEKPTWKRTKCPKRKDMSSSQKENRQQSCKKSAQVIRIHRSNQELRMGPGYAGLPCP